MLSLPEAAWAWAGPARAWRRSGGTARRSIRANPERATTLVAEGIYRWTRNPMCLGFVSVAAGAAVALGSPLALLGPALLAVYLDRVQIPAE